MTAPTHWATVENEIAAYAAVTPKIAVPSRLAVDHDRAEAERRRLVRSVLGTVALSLVPIDLRQCASRARRVGHAQHVAEAAASTS